MHINKQLIILPKDAIHKKLTEDTIDKILSQRAAILKEYFLEIIEGTNWIKIPPP
jgi:hypothetical protein